MASHWLYWALLSFTCVVAMKTSPPLVYLVKVNTTVSVFTTEEEYLSFDLDPFLLHDLPTRWGTFKFDHPRVKTLAKGLAPAIMRYGGTDADWQIFNKSAAYPKLAQGIAEPSSNANHFQVVLTPKDVDNLRNLAVQAGGKLLFDLNIQPRFGEQWSPVNALSLIDYMKNRGYGANVDFELGNEPPYQSFKPSGSRIGKDFLILKGILDKRPAFRTSRLVGPDIGVFGTGGYWVDILRDFVITAGRNLTAITIHHYYFFGPKSHVSDFINLAYFNDLKPTLTAVRQLVETSIGPGSKFWIGEGSDADGYGAPNISDRFVNGFLWLDKLGVSAREGYGLVARQIFYGGNYPLVNTTLDPTPDYWLSHVFKKLVGTRVLNVDIKSNSTGEGYVRGYAHCTTTRSSYPSGSITVFALNLLRGSAAKLLFDTSLSQQNVDIYLLSPVGPDGLLSKHVALNGKPISLVDDYTLPDLVPKHQAADNGIVMPALSFGFFVFSDASAEACL